MIRTSFWFGNLVLALTMAECFSEVVLDRTENIVGYVDIDLHPGYNLLSVPFQTIGAANATIDIQDAIQSESLSGFDWINWVDKDTLMFWNPYLGYYDTSYLWAGDTNTVAILGYDVSNTWMDAIDYTSVVAELPVGSAFWLNINAVSNILGTLSGEVPAWGTRLVPYVGGGDLVGSPFPREWDIQEIQSDQFVGLNANDEFQTTTKIWNGTGYTTYGWCADGQGTSGGVPEFDAKWLREDLTDVAVYTFDIGQGFWVLSPTSGVIQVYGAE